MVILVAPACVSTMEGPKLAVWAGFNAEAPQRTDKTYSITYGSALVQSWLAASPKALAVLGASLEELGYKEVLDPAAATYHINVELGFGSRAKNAIRLEENPDLKLQGTAEAEPSQGRYIQRVEEDMARTLIPTDSAGYDSLILRAWDVSDRKAGSEIPVWEIAVLRPVDGRVPSPEHVGILLGAAAAQLDAGWTGLPIATGARIAQTK
ncbi:MAG: hypothetical protein HY736_02365 [Verrucomicrobia bacterium]|nr:hypothetical protein [Verrucomicrobiota bacterium]